jgi:hypothetical protein
VSTGVAGSASSGADEETWEILEIDGVKVGYGRTSVHRETLDGEELLRMEGVTKMALKRAGQEVRMAIELSSLETPDGKLLEFDMQMSQGPLVMKTTGRVEGDQLKLQLNAQGKTTSSSIPWSDAYGGLQAVELSLSGEPMQPGEKRTIEAFEPGVNQIGTNELVARQYEEVELPDGTRELLRIDRTTTFSEGMSMRGSLWVDKSGEVLKQRQDAMKLVTYRTTKEIALEQSDVARYDLVTGLSVPVDRKLDDPYNSKRIRYRLQVDDRDPSEVFAAGPSQAIESVDPNVAIATVYALRPDQPGNPEAPQDAPTDGDRQPNSIVQSDNADIVALAEQAAGEHEDAWQAALALEKFVKRYMTLTDYSQAFATAADVAKSRRGDCTEHSVLLAALARARGIPARVAIGLIYIEEKGQPAFGYHMWNEVYVDDRWIPLDATLARGGAGAARLKLTHSNMDGASALSCFLPVAEAAGRLQIEILEVE